MSSPGHVFSDARHSSGSSCEQKKRRKTSGIQVAAGGRETFKQEGNKKIQPLFWCVFASSCVSYLLLETYLDSLVGGWATRLKNRLVELDHFLDRGDNKICLKPPPSNKCKILTCFLSKKKPSVLWKMAYVLMFEWYTDISTMYWI